MIITSRSTMASSNSSMILSMDEIDLFKNDSYLIEKLNAI